MKRPLLLVSRARAFRILRRWKEETYERMRNYELEESLAKTLGHSWCVAECCPFNGVHCRYGSLIDPRRMHGPTEVNGPIVKASRLALREQQWVGLPVAVSSQ